MRNTYVVGQMDRVSNRQIITNKQNYAFVPNKLNMSMFIIILLKSNLHWLTASVLAVMNGSTKKWRTHLSPAHS